MAQDALKTEFLAMLAEAAKQPDLTSVSPTTKLSEANIDSLTMLETLNDWEDKHRIEVPYSPNGSLHLDTIGDLLALLDMAEEKHQ